MIEVRLSEVASVIDCEHKTAPSSPEGLFRSIRTTDISNGILDIINANRIDELTYEEWTGRGKPEKNDIILAREAPVGEVGIVPEDNLIALGQRTVLIKIKDSRVIPLFLNYYLSSRIVKHELKIRATGSVVDHLNMSDIRSFPLNLPETNVQEAIAEVLSSLDDKIDLLKRQNKTLEGMAEALFRQWFIEEAQDDWEEVRMGELIEIRNGKDHKHLGEGKIPVYGSGGLMRKADDFLFEGESVLLPRKGTLNNVMLVNEAFWTVDTMFYTEMKRPNLMKFVFHHLKRLDLASMNVGSAVPSMTKTAYNDIAVLMPTEAKLEAFELQAFLIYEKVTSNNIEIQILTAQRDTLLPKLMSGEVRVKLD